MARLQATQVDLTGGSVWRVMLRYAWPIFLGTLLQSLYTTVDAIIIGQYAGKVALAAIESVGAVTKLPINFLTGLATGATILVAQYAGLKDDEKISEASHSAILLSLVGGVLLAVLGCLATPLCIRLLDVPPHIAHDAAVYSYIYFSGLAAATLYNVGSGVLRALGDSKTPFYFLLAANVFNAGLDYLFVAVFQLAVVGAAVATVLAQIASALMVLYVLRRSDQPCRIYWQKLKFHEQQVKSILLLGVPIGIQSSLYPLSNTIVQKAVNNLGVDIISAWSISSKLDFLIWSVLDSIAIAISNFVAQNFGRGQIKRARQGVRVGALMALISLLVLCSMLLIFNRQLPALLIQDPDVIGITAEILIFFAPCYFLFIPCDVLPAAVRGTGKSFMAMVITLLGTCVFRFPWVLWVVPHFPAFYALMATYPASWILTALMFIPLYLRSDLLHPPAEILARAAKLEADNSATPVES